jgi:predicted kinase
MNQTLFIMCGLPFSGKTTMAKQISDQLNAKMIAYDWIWAREKPPEEVPDPDNIPEWNEILNLTRIEIVNELKKGNSVVFDHINHTKKDRYILREIGIELKIKVITIFLNIPTDILKNRRRENIFNATRHNVATVNIKKVNKAWENPEGEPNVLTYNLDGNLNKFIKKLKEVKNN